MTTFNVHFNKAMPGKLQQGWVRRGFSAVISFEDAYDPYCSVGVSFCSKRDEFNKRKGLSIAALGSTLVHKKHLPQYLLDLEAQCFRDGQPLHPKGHYNYLLKNFIGS